MKYLTLGLYVLLSGCGWMSTTDSVLYISGRITNEDGLALSDITVDINGLQATTDLHGCFLFDGEYPEHPIKITISKAGYKVVREEKPYSGYFIRVMLSKTDSPKSNQLAWTELDISGPSLHVNCETEN